MLAARLPVHQGLLRCLQSPIRSQLRGQASSTRFGAVATTGERDTVICVGIGSASHTPSITTMDSNLRSERLSNGKGSAHHSPATFFTRDLAMAPRGGESAMEEWWARSQRQRDLASRFHRSCRLRLRVCECVLLIAVGCDISAPKRVKVGYHLLAPRLNPANSNHKDVEITRDRLATADRVGLMNYSILNVCSASSPSSFVNGCVPPARSSTAHSFVPDLGKGLSATLTL